MSRGIILFLFAVLLFGCSDNETSRSNDLQFFKTHLSPGMQETLIIKTFGAADVDIGSGIHIYRYSLDDGTHVIIGCTDTLMYAHHVDSQLAMIDRII